MSVSEQSKEFHDEILKSLPDSLIQEAIDRAVALGVPRDEAEKLYRKGGKNAIK